MKRFLSLLLVLAMCLGMFPVGVLADPAEEQQEVITAADSFEMEETEETAASEEPAEPQETEEAALPEEAEEVSEEAQFRAGEPVLVITEQPEDTLSLDGVAYFVVAAQVLRDGEAEEASFAYQWQQLAGDTWVDLEGQTEEFLAAEDPETGDTFRCVVSWEGLTAVSEAAAVTGAEETPEVFSTVWINPEYQDLYTEADFGEVGSYAVVASDKVCHSDEEVLAALREAMADRVAEPTVTLDYDIGNGQAYLDKICALLYAHNGNPKQGDYLGYAVGGYRGGLSGGQNGYTLSLTNVKYYTTAAQEAQADAAVSSILKSLNLTGKTQKQKVDAIYSWLTNNVTYDNANLNNDSYMAKYAGFAALVNRTAVCQGYAGAFYRLCMESGIDSRVISCRNMNHAWNIVGLDGSYYHLDATWDANRPSSPRYYLKGTVNWLKDHKSTSTQNISELGDQFQDADFKKNYPVPEEDYTESAAPVTTVTVTIAEGEKSEKRQLKAGARYFDYDLTLENNDGDPLAALRITDKDGNTRLITQSTTDDSANVREGDVKVELLRESAVVIIKFYADADGTNLLATLTVCKGEALGALPKPDGEAVKWYTEDGVLLEEGKIYDFQTALVNAYPKRDGEENPDKCGDDLTWTFENGTLRISGTGEMWDFSGDMPWVEFQNEIIHVVVDAGAESIGNGAFANCKNLKTVQLPDTLTRIGNGAFDGCTLLTDIHYNGTLAQWKAIQGREQLDGRTLHTTTPTYSITYIDVPDDVENPNPTTAEAGKTLTLQELSRKGYSFEGWYDAEEGGTKITRISGDNQQDITLYARWELITYSIHLDGNGLLYMQTYDARYNELYWPNLDRFVRPGYTLIGWNTKADGTGTAYPLDEPMMNLCDVQGGTVVLYAQWEERSYTVKFDANGGQGAAEDITVKYTAFLTLPKNGFMYTGYGFTGWNTQADGSGYGYAPGQKVSGLTEEDSITLYAQWMEKGCQIIFEGNGEDAEGQTEGVKAPWDTAVVIPECGFTRRGYTFTVWNTRPDGRGTKYEPGQEVKNLKAEGTVTLYAQWRANTYTFRFLPGAEEYAGSTGDMPNLQNARSYRIPRCGYTRMGYTFAGWRLKGLEELWQPGNTVAMHGVMDGQIIEIEAQWTPITYNIRYMPNGGTGKMADETGAVYDVPMALRENAFRRTGYHFVGWNTRADGKGIAYGDMEEVVNLASTGRAYATLYAQWEGDPYDVIFHYGEETQRQTLRYGTYETLNKNTFEKPGYKFRAWNTLETGRGQTYWDGYRVLNLGGGQGEIHLYAQWTANRYTVVFHSNHGTREMIRSQSLTYDGKDTALYPNAFTWKGHAFQGWSLTREGQTADYADRAMVRNLTTGATIDLYAIWKVNTYTVVLDSNGAGQDAVSQNMTYDVASPLTANPFTRDGYDFAGWSTMTRGRAYYTDGQTVKNLTERDGAEVRLYALWNPYTYTVRFDKNSSDAVGNMPDRRMTVGRDGILGAAGYRLKDYTFAGWNTMPDGSGTAYAGTARVRDLTTEKNGTVTLYAMWNPTQYTISYTNLTAAETGDLLPSYNVTTTEDPGTPTRLGCTFEGWYLDARYTRPFTGFAGRSGLLRLYPKWAGTAARYTVVYAPGAEDVTGNMDRIRQTNLLCGRSYTPYGSYYRRTGYLFAGWVSQYGDQIAVGKQFSNLCREDGEIITLRARWTPIRYNVRFLANRGTGTMADETGFVYDEGRTLNPNAFTRKGYSFAGWNANANGTGKAYADGAEVKNLYALNNGTTYLYAQWQANTYTVKFDPNGGVGTMDDMQMTYDQLRRLNTNTFTKEGSRFLGWSTVKDSARAAYWDAGYVRNLAESGTVTLYAVWSK